MTANDLTAPVPTGERVELLDTLRGFALLDIGGGYPCRRHQPARPAGLDTPALWIQAAIDSENDQVILQ